MFTAGGFEVQVIRDGAPEEKITARLVNMRRFEKGNRPGNPKIQEMVRFAQTVKSNK
jgi:hypothetical protein